MWTDPIVQEIHAIRKKIMQEAGWDLHQAILTAHKNSKPGRRILQGHPRRPTGWGAEMQPRKPPTSYPLGDEK